MRRTRRRTDAECPDGSISYSSINEVRAPSQDGACDGSIQETTHVLVNATTEEGIHQTDSIRR